MKTRIILISLILAISIFFTACQKAPDKTDKEISSDREYIRSYDLKGVSFLMPRKLFNQAEPMKDVVKIDVDEACDHIYKSFSDQEYMLYKPNYFFLYVKALDNAEGIASDKDVADVSKKLNMENVLRFEAANPKKFSSKKVNENSISMHTAVITESFLGKEFTYDGYVSVIHDGYVNKDFCLCVGYTDKKHGTVSKTIAESFKIYRLSSDQS